MRSWPECQAAVAQSTPNAANCSRCSALSLARLHGREYLGSYRRVTVPVTMRWSEQRPLVPVLTGVQSVEVARVSAL